MLELRRRHLFVSFLLLTGCDREPPAAPEDLLLRQKASDPTALMPPKATDRTDQMKAELLAGKGLGKVSQKAATPVKDGFSGLQGIKAGKAAGLGRLGTRGTGSGGGGLGIGGLSNLNVKGGSGFGRGSGYGRGGAKASSHAANLRSRGGEFLGRETPRLNPSVSTKQDKLSTFAVDVDTAAYSIARRALLARRMPPNSLVRVEEFLNYFHYDYDPPTQTPFSIQVDGARSPVDDRYHYLRIGIQAKIVNDADRHPANLVFLVDTSGSMRSQDKLGLAKKALKLATERLTANDRVAITTYAGGVRLVLKPTAGNQKQVIEQAIDRLASGGGTAMESGLVLAYQQALKMKRNGTITRIIVCSDGDANIGATRHHEIMKRIKGYVEEGIFLSTIGFGDGHYQDETMEQLANRGNGNYFYVDSERQAQRVFSRDFTKMLQDVAKDVKIQVEFNEQSVASYRLIGYENREIADADFRRDEVDAGEIGAGHQVTALYELTLTDTPSDQIAVVRVRAKRPNGHRARETTRAVTTRAVQRPFLQSPRDLRFAVAVMGFAELMRHSPYAHAWSYERVLSLLGDDPSNDPDRRELTRLVAYAQSLSGSPAVSLR